MLKNILQYSAEIAFRVAKKKQCALVHCSDGWDRTSQLCSLSEMMIDPYYRTIKGFEVIIEKEWVSFGHKFETR
jgi:myotubularin-related protein 1/2